MWISLISSPLQVDHEFIPNYKLLQAAFDRLGRRWCFGISKFTVNDGSSLF